MTAKEANLLSLKNQTTSLEQIKAMFDGDIKKAAKSGKFKLEVKIASDIRQHWNIAKKDLEMRGFKVERMMYNTERKYTISWEGKKL